MNKIPGKITRRDFLRILKEALISFIALTSGSSIYAYWLEPGWLDVENLELPISGLPKVFSGFRIVQVSDIHMGGWMNREHLHDIIKTIREQERDLVVMTGDFVTGHSWTRSLDVAAEDFISEVRPLTQEILTLAVMGNHDHWTDAEMTRSMLARAGIVELNNDVYPFRRGEDRLFVAGVDDIWEDKARLDKVVAKLPPRGPAVLLAHEPDFADESSQANRFCLQLSGHTHGGQVVLPFVGPPILPRFGRRCPLGLYQVGEMWQYTNRGVGMIEPAVRFNCRPEITVISLKSA